jgi:predicted flap endonuclease-1-like 5' DNA nuclease/predicted  nucleic acid-binding Zn-ribbon protein
MPEINVIHITIFAVLTVVGAVAGWAIRGKRATDEKAVANAGWQEQINAQRKEHDRLTEQNKALMEQISQYLASNKGAKSRAAELAEVVKDADQRRDQLQREIRAVRESLEVSVNERDQLQSDISSKAAALQDAEAKDVRIKKLRLALEGWQNRLPPLIDKFQQRNEEANQLESELVAARERIVELEAQLDTDETVIGSVCDPQELTDGRDASNDPVDDSKAEIVPNEPGENDFEELVAPEDVLDTDDDQFCVDKNEDADGTEVEIEVEVVVDEDDEDEDDYGVDEDVDDDDDDELDDNSDSLIDDMRDDLKAIKGVGPAIEKTLYELGIRRYYQIADMSEYDIDRIAKHLKGFRSRIYREDWIGQARDLGDQDSSD